jgi:enoyl-CoA hydratase
MSKVIVETQGPIAIFTLNRPEQRNAIDAELSDALRQAIDHFEADDTLRVAILRGNGRVFCAGMDLRAFTDGQGDDILFGRDRLGGLVSRARSKPIIASVQGAALAGGFELMLACDLAVAATGCLFGLPEAKLGLVAGAGGAIRIAQRVPRFIANQILLTGDPIDAQTALQFGLVNTVVPPEQLGDATLDLASRIAANAPGSIRESLHLTGTQPPELTPANWHENDQSLRRLIGSDDVKEGIASFLEKRPPDWTGR